MKKDMLRGIVKYTLTTTSMTLAMATVGASILESIEHDQYTPKDMVLAVLVGQAASCLIECSLSAYFSNSQYKLNPLSSGLYDSFTHWLLHKLSISAFRYINTILTATYTVFYTSRSTLNIMLGKYLLDLLNNTNDFDFLKVLTPTCIGAAIASPIFFCYITSLSFIGSETEELIQDGLKRTFCSEGPTATLSTTTQHLLVTTVLTAISACMGAAILNAAGNQEASLIAVLLASVCGQTLVNLGYFAGTYLISLDDEPYYTMHDEINHNRKFCDGSLFQSILPFISCLFSMLVGQPFIRALNLDEGLSLNESICSGVTGSAILIPFILYYSCMNLCRYEHARRGQFTSDIERPLTVDRRSDELTDPTRDHQPTETIDPRNSLPNAGRSRVSSKDHGEDAVDIESQSQFTFHAGLGERIPVADNDSSTSMTQAILVQPT